MTVVVSDDFTGTAGATLESRAGAVGAVWTRCSTSVAGSAQVVASGSLSAQTEAGTNARYIASGVPTTIGYDLDVDLKIQDTAIPSGRPRTYVRGSATDLYANAYQIWYAGDFFYIDKIVAGVETNLAFWAPATPFVTGSTHHMKVTVRGSGTRIEVYIDGVSVMTSTDATHTAIGTVGLGFLGGDTGVRMQNFVVTDTASGAPATFTLVAASGAYSIAGQAAGLLAGRKLTATTGAYTIGGRTVGLLRAARLALATGAYAIAGRAAGLLKASRIALVTGAYSIAGQAVGLTKSVTGYVLSLASGVYAVSGKTVGLAAARKLTTATGAYTITGRPVTLSLMRRLALAAGSYAIAGRTLALAAARRLTTAPGLYTINGFAAGLRYSGEALITPVRSPTRAILAPTRTSAAFGPTSTSATIAPSSTSVTLD